MKQRLKAIWYALYYGVLPWWMYEAEKHYTGSYWGHLLGNIGYALRWLSFLEREADRTFEQTVNKNS